MLNSAIKINNLSKLAQNTPIALDQARRWIEEFFSKHPNALEVIGEVCPTWASDKTAFFNCLSQFAVGNLSIVIKGVATNLAVPGVLWEGSQYMNSEKQVLYWTMSMVWQGTTMAFGELFSSVGTYMKGTIDGYMTGAVCQYVPSMLRMGYSCGVPPVAEAAAAFTAATANAASTAAATAVPTSVAWSFRSLLPWGGGDGNSSDAILSLQTQTNLDTTLSTASLYLIMAYSINPITCFKGTFVKCSIIPNTILKYTIIESSASPNRLILKKLTIENTI